MCIRFVKIRALLDLTALQLILSPLHPGEAGSARNLKFLLGVGDVSRWAAILALLDHMVEFYGECAASSAASRAKTRAALAFAT